MTDSGWLPEAFLEQSPACHWAVDREEVFQSIYGDPSPLFGREAAELKGKPASVMPPELARVWAARFARVFAGEVLMLRERRGNATWYVSLFPIRRRKRIVYAGGLAREITPWSTAEQELRQTVLS